MAKSKAEQLFGSIPDASKKEIVKADYIHPPIDEIKPPLAGQEASRKASKKDGSEKKKFCAVRLGREDAKALERLARRLKKEGLQYSNGSAIRLALRAFNASDEVVARIAEEIKSEDRRGHR